MSSSAQTPSPSQDHLSTPLAAPPPPLPPSLPTQSPQAADPEVADESNRSLPLHLSSAELQEGDQGNGRVHPLNADAGSESAASVAAGVCGGPEESFARNLPKVDTTCHHRGLKQCVDGKSRIGNDLGAEDIEGHEVRQPDDTPTTTTTTTTTAPIEDRPVKERPVKSVVIKDDRGQDSSEAERSESRSTKDSAALRIPRKSLPLLPRIDQYEKHPLLQTKSRTGITEFEMLMIERELLKRRKSMEERCSPVQSSTASSTASSSASSSSASSGSSSFASSRRRVGGSLRQPTKLIPRGAHYEPHPLLKRTADGVYELERILHEKHQQQQQLKQTMGAAAAAGQRSMHSNFGQLEPKKRNGSNCIRKTEEEEEEEDEEEDDGEDAEAESVSMETDARENASSQLKRVRFRRQKGHVTIGNDDDDDRKPSSSSSLSSSSAAAAMTAMVDSSNGLRRPEVEESGKMTSSLPSDECAAAVAMTTEEAENRQQRTEKRAEKAQPNQRIDFIGRSCCLS